MMWAIDIREAEDFIMATVVIHAGSSTPTAPPCHVTSSTPRSWKWDRAQYYRLAELGFFTNQRVELVQGEIVIMSPMNEPHVRGVILALEALRAAFPTGYTLRPQSPLDFGDSAPEPDVAVVTGAPRDIIATPTSAILVVEVAETSLDYDTSTKAELYAMAGVPDYWVVDLPTGRLLVFRDPGPLPAGLGASAYRTHLSLAPDQMISPLAAPSASICVADLLP